MCSLQLHMLSMHIFDSLPNLLKFFITDSYREYMPM
jgi:hypothetical protein